MLLNKKNISIFFSVLFILLNFLTNYRVLEIKTAQTNKSMLKHSQDHMELGALTSKIRSENSATKRCHLIEDGLTPCEFQLIVYQYDIVVQNFFENSLVTNFFESDTSARAPPALS